MGLSERPRRRPVGKTGLGCIQPALSPIPLVPHRTLGLLLVGLQLAGGFALAAALLYASWYGPKLFCRLLLHVLPGETYRNLAYALGKMVLREGLLPFWQPAPPPNKTFSTSPPRAQACLLGHRERVLPRVPVPAAPRGQAQPRLLGTGCRHSACRKPAPRVPASPALPPSLRPQSIYGAESSGGSTVFSGHGSFFPPPLESGNH